MIDDEAAQVEALLDEYRAAVAKVDGKAASVIDRRQADLACQRGCADCCAPNLNVLPVEAFAIETFLERTDGEVLRRSHPDRCAFLDEERTCMIYEARPLLCRSHGLPIRMPGAGGRGQLPVLDDDTWACALNFTAAAPEPDDVLCGVTMAALLATVDARFRERAGLPAGEDRVGLTDIYRAFVSADH